MKIYCDGGARGNPGPAASAFIVYRGEKIIHKESKFIGESTNNIAEYTALFMAVKHISLSGFDGEVTIVLDSELVKKQMTGEYRIKNEKLKELALEIKKMILHSKAQVHFVHTLRRNNSEADALVNIELDRCKQSDL